jgi:hypothetical protein
MAAYHAGGAPVSGGGDGCMEPFYADPDQFLLEIREQRSPNAGPGKAR